MTNLTSAFRDLWADELESGRRTQGHGAMRKDREDGTVCECCLGVAVSLKGYKPKTFGTEEKGLRLAYFDVGFRFPNAEGLKAIGIDRDTAWMLAGMNDGQGGAPPRDFTAIAAVIRNLPTKD